MLCFTRNGGCCLLDFYTCSSLVFLQTLWMLFIEACVHQVNSLYCYVFKCYTSNHYKTISCDIREFLTYGTLDGNSLSKWSRNALKLFCRDISIQLVIPRRDFTQLPAFRLTIYYSYLLMTGEANISALLKSSSHPPSPATPDYVFNDVVANFNIILSVYV